MKEKSLNLIPNFPPMHGFLMDTFKDEEKINKKKNTSVTSKKQMKYLLKHVFKYLRDVSKQGNVQALLRLILLFYFSS